MSVSLPPKDIVCVAQAVYHEARGASNKDKELVAELVWNRAKDLHTSTCRVINMKGQFPWARYKHKLKEPKLWYESISIGKRTECRYTKVRYVVSTSSHVPHSNIHVLYKDRDLMFYNRFIDPVFRNECINLKKEYKMCHNKM